MEKVGSAEGWARVDNEIKRHFVALGQRMIELGMSQSWPSREIPGEALRVTETQEQGQEPEPSASPRHGLNLPTPVVGLQSETREIALASLPPAPIGTPKSSDSNVRGGRYDSPAQQDPRRQEAAAPIAEERPKQTEDLSEPVSGEAESYQRAPLEEIIGHYGIAGVHPAADLVPMSTDEEFQAGCRDVKARGFLHPVKVTNKNLLIDGRNRLQIGWALGLDPALERFNPSDPIAYVLSENVVRRHLTVGQRAMIAEKLATLPRGRPRGKSEEPQNFQRCKSQAEAAGELYVTPKAITMARTIRRWGAPEEVQAVEAGAESLEQAYERAQKKKYEAEGKPPPKRKKQSKQKKDSPDDDAPAAVALPAVAAELEASSYNSDATKSRVPTSPSDVETPPVPVSETSTREDHLKALGSLFDLLLKGKDEVYDEPFLTSQQLDITMCRAAWSRFARLGSAIKRFVESQSSR
jgi:hypothetical protein